MINDYEATRPITTNAFVPSVDIKEETVTTLNGLIAVCKDGETGFREAADGVNQSDLKTLFGEFSSQRAQFAGELQSLVHAFGGDPNRSGSLAGAMHQGWMNIKAAVTGKDEAAILNECERGEDAAKMAYQEAQGHDLPDYVLETIQNQYQSVLTAHDLIKELRDAAKEDGSSTARTGF
ncbi:MAG: ferritin-like domain-containing protein [Blastocatellia bacterium]